MKKLGCKVHTFDCTVGTVLPTEIPKGIEFHPWCIGSQNERRSFSSDLLKSDGLLGQFYTIQTVMEKLNHKVVDILKIDIERHEYAAFEHFKCPQCFRQVALEVHLHNAYNMWGRPVSPYEWDRLWYNLAEVNNFRIFNYEPNDMCACCCEYSLMS